MKILKLISKTHCADIILALNKKDMTFGEISKLVTHTGIASVRLKELKKENIVNRKVMQDESRTVEYSLTNKGKEIVEAIVILGKL